MTREKAKKFIQEAKQITFLTGAGVSVPSGIPDYRSMTGIYQGMSQPEYLLSATCLEKEPEKFYSFIKHLYHPSATPNSIHQKMSEIERLHPNTTIVTQNIDQLHQQAGSQNVLNFHGNLYDCYCMKCKENVPADVYRRSDIHEDCGGRIRPGVVLYGEALDEGVVNQSIRAVYSADLLVIVGTSFNVHPFCDLLQYKNESSNVVVVNKEDIFLHVPYVFVQEDATNFFATI